MKRSDLLRVEKKIFIGFLFVFMIFLIALSGCDQLTDSNDEPETLYVKFINDSTSTHVITNIQFMAMGKSGESESVADSVWSDNILKTGESIAPDNHKFFTVEIPNLHYSIYRLGVDNGNGNEIILHEQEGYEQETPFTPTITHWGSDERTVTVSIDYNSEKKVIYIAGYGDWAGIE